MTPQQFSVSRYYFTLYLSASLVVTYFPIWLNAKGLSNSEIGWINTLPMALILVTSIFIGRIADRAHDWKQVIVIGSLISFIASLFVAFASGFAQILIIWAAVNTTSGLVGPVADGATMQLAERLGFSFGTVRAWGTIGYLLLCAVAGYVILALGPASFPWLVAAMIGLRTLNALLLPSMRDSSSKRPSGGGRILSHEFRAALKLWVLLPLIAGSLNFATHMIMNGFSSLVWKQQGISEGMIGILVAIGGIAEAGSMFVWGSIHRRMAARHLILIAALACVLRWTVMALSPPLILLVPLQLLQGVTFTFSFLGCLYFITNHTGEAIAAEAQSFFSVLQQASSVVIVTLFGYGFEHFGPITFLFPAVLSLVVAGLVVMSLHLKPAAKLAA